MTGPEYRQDDLTDRGYCPRCGQQLSTLTTDGRGFCEQHGQQWAEWHSDAYHDDVRKTQRTFAP